MGFSLTIISFFVLIILGMPIAIAMIVMSLSYVVIYDLSPQMLSINMFAGLENFVLLAIPLFLLTAEVMNRTSVSKRILDFANSIVGYISGGMGHVNVLTSIIFAGMSGSAVADVGGIGHLSYEGMVRDGYDKEFSAAVTMASSTIGPIIPPSIPMVVYAMVADVSIGRLFFGGIIPGLLIGISQMIYIYFISKRRNYPKKQKIPFKQYIRDVFASLIHSIFPLLTPLILLGGIYFGVVTITEAAAVAVLYALVLGIILYRNLNFEEFFKSLRHVFVNSGAVLLVIIAGKAFGFVLTTEHAQEKLYNFMVGFAGDNKILLILMINILFIILGCISDPVVNIMLFVPMVIPIAMHIGLDPVHFGVAIVLNAMIGNVTPPVGSVLMTVCSIEKLNYQKTIRAVFPFIIMLVALLAIIFAIPETVTFIPNLLFNK